jgi:putative protein-disulfide isomerase
MKNTLIYVHDPMCSWCWGFEAARSQLFDAVSGDMRIERLLGGLAPDSDQPMPESMQQMLQQTWARINQLTGAPFNFDFWRQCKPRRSTYPANRAVIAAREQGDEFDSAMTARIQQAYYREARNPSDDETLVALAADIGLDADRFEASLNSAETHDALQAEIMHARSIGVEGFPSLVVEGQGRLCRVRVNYTDPDAMLRDIETANAAVA